jgi:hypothetical protein
LGAGAKIRSLSEESDPELLSCPKRLDEDDEALVVDDELMGIPPGELVDEADELGMSGISNAGTAVPDGGAETGPDGGADTRPDGGAGTAVPDGGADTGPDGGAALESSDPPAGWPAWPSFAARPLPPLGPVDPCKTPGEPVVWPLSGSVDGLLSWAGVPPVAESRPWTNEPAPTAAPEPGFDGAELEPTRDAKPMPTLPGPSP